MEKKLESGGIGLKIPCHKAILAMKLTCFLMCCLLFNVQAAVKAQGQTVSLKLEQVSVAEAIRQLKEQTQLDFFFSNKQVDVDRKVSLDLQDIRLDEALKMLLGEGYAYEFLDDVVVIKPVEVKNPEMGVPQEKVTVKGVVRDEKGHPLSGVAILLKGTTIGVATDIDGKYSLQLPSSQSITLVFSFVGMKTQEIAYTGQSELNVVMVAEASELEDVVVTGYQTIAKERSTGAYSSVNAKTLEQKPTSNLAKALTGLIPGLAVMDAPVDGTTRFVIRGIGTLQDNQEDRDPLIVVDGFPISGYTDNNDPFSSINPNDVESVTVLKDAAATSIYGARAANGVIVITTKKGRVGSKMEISADAYWAVSSRVDLDYLFNMASAENQFRFEELMHKYNPVNLTGTNDPYTYPAARRLYLSAPHALLFERDGKKNITSEEYDSRKQELIEFANRELWKKDLNEYIFQRMFSQQYNVALRGATDKLNYSFSASFDKEDNFLKGNVWKRVLLNLSSTANLTKNLSFDFSISTSFEKDENNGTDIAEMKEWLSPWTRLVDDNGEFVHVPTSSTVYEPLLWSEYDGKTPVSWDYNPVTEREHSEDYAKTMNYRIQGGFDYKTSWGMKISAKGQYEYRHYNHHVLHEPESFFVRDLYNTYSTLNENSDLYVSYFPTGGVFSDEGHTYEAYNLRGQVDYDWENDRHGLNVLAGTEVISATTEADPKVTRYGFNENTNAVQTQLDYVTQRDNIFGEYTRLPYEDLGSLSTLEDRFFSVYANLAYTYNGLYTLTASFRTDASNFQAKKMREKFSPFWSIGGSWLISQEDFMRKKSWVDFLMLRISYGIAGVAAGKKGTSSVTTVEVHPGDLVYSAGESFNTIANRGNDQLTWEKSRTLNVGLDFALWKHKLAGSVNFYNRYSYDVLAQTTVPVITQGVNSATLNNAEVLNRGVEISLNASLPLGGNWQWSGMLNYSYNHNKVKKYHYTGPYMPVAAGYVEDFPIGFVACFKPAGYTPEGYVLLQGKDGSKEAILDMETSRYFDYVTPAERQNFDDNNWAYYLGSSVPTSNLTYSSQFAWKGLTLSFMITGQFGYYVNTMDILDVNTNKASYSKQLDKSFEVYDEGYGSQSAYSAFPLYNDDNYEGFRNGAYDWTLLSATFFRNNYIKGDHIRLNEVYLGYDLPDSWLKRQKVFNRINLYAQASNLGLIWSANGKMDPMYTIGNVKPVPTFTLGLKLGFKDWK